MIRFAKLRKEFDTLVAVHDLEVEIPPGEVYGLIGPNGAGKTTTIRMACGLLSPTSGKVFINGIDVHSEPERAQAFIGYLSDFFSVYEDLKVWEYLDYFAHAYKLPESEIPARIDQVIAQVGLEVKRDAFIKGLSRGMKQRLGIGRAIIHRPKVLLLDEPASGLDPKARMDLRNVLLSLRDDGATILISSHILTELEGFCTSIGLMEKGNMVRSGRIEQIVADASPVRVVRLAWARDGRATVESALKSATHVSDVLVRDHDGLFKFAGAEDELTDVLTALIGAGVRVTAFGEVKQTVEDLYVKLSRNEVM
ncbi:MAG TPA: ABC transporter ATP-binding protein [Terriglobales bacterium]|nr:ABC transporter ATP-binding protein [Terriglobales bacterium]